LLLRNIRLSTNIADSLFVDGTNAIPITTHDALGEIDLIFICPHLASATTAIIALFWRLPPTFRAMNIW
jgi:hypothetical protein